MIFGTMTRMRIQSSPILLSFSKQTQRSQQATTRSVAGSLKSLLSQLERCFSSPSVLRFHANILKTQFFNDPFLLTRLAHAYLSFKNLTPAKRILMNFPKNPPLFLWNETIKGFSRNGFFRESIDLYYLMVTRGVRPNEFTFTFVLPACAGAQALTDGRRVHENIERMGMQWNLFVATAIVDMYGKCKEILAARKVFDEMPQRGIAAFNAMIAGYVFNGEYEEAMSIFEQMQRSELQYDAMTMVSVLQACSSLGALQRGRRIHEQLITACTEINVHLAAALINMYARCGSIEESQRVFNRMLERDLISWTAIICAYGMHGLAEDAEILFNQMLESGIKPDSITFVGILSGFSHKGMVDEGQKYFKKMTEEFHILPTLEHCSCMVDLLGRAGKLEEAERFIKEMNMNPDAGVWGGLLNASMIYANVEIGGRVIKEILKMDPSNAGWYVLMSNIYANARHWDGVAEMRMLMRAKKVSKTPGWSSIEIEGKVHRFIVFDRSHPNSVEIYEFLNGFDERMRREGNDAETKCVFVNSGE